MAEARKENDMTKIRSFLLILAALAISAMLPPCAYAEDLTISNAGELRSFRDAVNAGDGFAGKTVLLAADVDLGGEPWVPIGTSETPFAGESSDGKHAISGLSVTTETMGALTAAGAQAAGGGLFLNVAGDGAQIANLTVEGAIDGAPSANALAAGGIAARLGPGAVIYRCLNKASVTLGGTGTGRDPSAYAGGAAGYSEGHVIYCVNEGVVTARAETVYTMAGGIVGAQRGGGILFSDNDAPVAAQDIGGYRRAYAGGIAGSAESTSIACVRNQQAVSSYTLAGGITAFAMDSVLRDAVNAASVNCAGQEWSDAAAGGITAQLYNGSAAVNCYNTGEIVVSGSPSYSYAGGIAGWSSAGFYSSNKIYNCTNSGSVSGKASGGARTGGIAGELDKTELYSSVSSGAVSAVPASELGGIVGYKNADAVVRDSAYSGELPAVGSGARTVDGVRRLTREQISDLVVTSFPSLDPAIAVVKSGETKQINVKLHSHPGAPSDEGAYYALDEAYTEPAAHAYAAINGDAVTVTGGEPGVSLLAAYVETYRSGEEGADKSSPSRSLVTALVWTTEAAGEEPVPEIPTPDGDDGNIDIPAGPIEIPDMPGEQEQPPVTPPLWPDGVLPPEVPGESDTDKDWNDRYPHHSCGGGGCNYGWGALAMLAFAPLALRRKRQRKDI